MRLGLGLQMQRLASGEIIRVVPRKPCRVRHGDLTNAIAWVVRNEPQLTRLVVTVMDANAYYHSTDAGGCYTAVIPYHAFKRVERLSKFHTQPPGHALIRPTKSGTNMPYRTREEVRLT